MSTATEYAPSVRIPDRARPRRTAAVVLPFPCDRVPRAVVVEATPETVMSPPITTRSTHNAIIVSMSVVPRSEVSRFVMRSSIEEPPALAWPRRRSIRSA